MDKEESLHSIHDSWVLWAHLPHDTDWSISSYKKIMTFNYIEQVIVLTETLPVKMVQNCMLFLMREGISPMWEDAKNKMGGCFSYKVNNKEVVTVWKELTYTLTGETLSMPHVQTHINGITISPKKSFCIIKIWLDNCDNQDPTTIKDFSNGLTPRGCIFKKHK
jgi:hypothetical protein